jgi:adenylosuccinate synthase
MAMAAAVASQGLAAAAAQQQRSLTLASSPGKNFVELAAGASYGVGRGVRSVRVRCEAQALEREVVKVQEEDAFSSLKQVCAVLGTQWGDEGKGKLVDILAERFDVVARCQVWFCDSLLLPFCINWLKLLADSSVGFAFLLHGICA